MCNREEIIQSVCRKYAESKSNSFFNADRREENARNLGLEPIGRPSVFAELVAVHPDAPDMVIKVVPKGDPGYIYAKDCFEGRLGVSSLVPVIYALHEVGDNAFIYMERLYDEADMEEDCQARFYGVVHHFLFGNTPHLRDFHLSKEEKIDCLGFWCYLQVQLEFHKAFDRMDTMDCHSGNFMMRKNGDVVCIDPWV